MLESPDFDNFEAIRRGSSNRADAGESPQLNNDRAIYQGELVMTRPLSFVVNQMRVFGTCDFAGCRSEKDVVELLGHYGSVSQDSTLALAEPSREWHAAWHGGSSDEVAVLSFCRRIGQDEFGKPFTVPIYDGKLVVWDPEEMHALPHDEGRSPKFFTIRVSKDDLVAAQEILLQEDNAGWAERPSRPRFCS
jgi:hypothetical protein